VKKNLNKIERSCFLNYLTLNKIILFNKLRSLDNKFQFI